MSLNAGIAFSFGVIFVVTLLALAIKFPRPTTFQYTIFRSVFALAGAGVAAIIPGFLDLQLTQSERLIVRAGGALAVFVIIFFFNPASIAISRSSDLGLAIPERLPDGSAFPPDMRETFNRVWRALMSLQMAGERLWQHVSDSNLAAFAERWHQARDLVRDNALFFSDSDYRALEDALRAANLYLGGKMRLSDIRGGVLHRRERWLKTPAGIIHDDDGFELASEGQQDRLLDDELRRQIQQNKRWLSRYRSLLSTLRSSLHKAL